ncbi:MAG: type II toxin-antitoxin system RatA family toxin [Neisseria sp.]|nr:type II toxin-antitoxin system RatA family toxin [Neisseria sp.]
MVQIKKTVLVTHSAAEMFELVDNVSAYPQFLPWCSKSEVLKREGNQLEAMLYMDYMRIRQHFGTRNQNIPDREIRMTLLDGPFKQLHGLWQFTPLGTVGCKIYFELHYEFSNALLGKLIGPVFSHVSNSLVNSFIKEADRRYGK